MTAPRVIAPIFSTDALERQIHDGMRAALAEPEAWRLTGHKFVDKCRRLLTHDARLYLSRQYATGALYQTDAALFTVVVHAGGAPLPLFRRHDVLTCTFEYSSGMRVSVVRFDMPGALRERLPHDMDVERSWLSAFTAG